MPKLRHSHLNPQAIEFFEKEILITSETYLEKQVFPRVIEGTDVGAYLLITFDGDSMEALEPTIERAATLLLSLIHIWPETGRPPCHPGAADQTPA